MTTDRIKDISHPLNPHSSIMAAKMLSGFLQNRIFSLLLCVLLQGLTVDGSDGIFSRTEGVPKTRLHNTHETFTEQYLDYACYRYHSYSYCLRTRLSFKPVTKIETYTDEEIIHYCCAGYTKTSPDGSALVCEPICDFLCPNGKCTKPNYCECDSGYSKKPGTENICEPVCSHECVHGYCSKPESCSCDFGYDHNMTSPYYVCSPVCTNPCVNAYCTSPNVCSCKRGFAKTLYEPHKCHAVCSRHCLNGICSTPEECTCFEGYTKDNSSWNVCSPVCPEGCENAECTAPDVCTCFQGFEKNGSICQPKCSRECVNGFCTGPDLCSCSPGYQMDTDSYFCDPICSSGCVNGNCTQPDRCECFPGYEEAEENICRPYCSEGCGNGICTNPEECTCLWGFEKGNSSNCTHQGKTLDCTLISEFVNPNFDNCFKLTGEVSLANLKNCEILQYLALYKEEIGRELDLYCEGVTDLEQSRSGFDLRMECIAKMSAEANLREQISSTEVYSEELSSESTIYWSTDPKLLSQEEGSLSTETFEATKSSTEISQINTSERAKKQTQFNITFKGEYVETNKMSELPLHLNVTLKFLPLIEKFQLTQDHFGNFTLTKREFCLCNRNQRNWNICADSPLLLHLCACEPRKLNILLEEPSASVLNKTVILFVVMAALLSIGYILYKKYQSVYYLT